MSAARRTAQAIDALRHGWAISITGDSVRPLCLLPVETALTAPDSAEMLISAARADTLKLTNQKAAAAPDAPVRMTVPGEMSAERALAIADPVRDLASPMKGPFVAAPLGDAAAAIAAMELARRAGIVPAYYILPGFEGETVDIGASDLADYGATGHIGIAVRARLPVAAHENAEIVAFRSPNDLREHIALIIGNRDDTVPLVRLHSECLTGDILGSLKCDCGPQLHEAMDEMAASSGWGVLLYLRQEGRGIGLINKMRAYSLQDQGFDTVDANNRLGLPTEARDFGIAARMLELLHIARITLLTNNPQKVEILQAHGIGVVERRPLKIAANKHNARYLHTKKVRTGHQL